MVFAARPSFQVEDLWEWHTASDPRISPDGARAVYIDEHADRTADTFYSSLSLVSIDGKQREALTSGSRHDRLPRWAPDSTRVAYVSDGTIHIRILGAADPEPIRTGSAPIALSWSPDGHRLAYTARVPPPRPTWAPVEILPRLRTGEGRIAVFALNLPAADSQPHDAARPVSRAGMDYLDEPSWTPDGRSLVVARADGAVCAIRIDRGTEQCLASPPARGRSPIVSPDGTRIAWVSADQYGRSYAVRKVWVMNADGSRPRVLSGLLDRDARSPQWSSDSRTVYFLADDAGATHVYAAQNDGIVRQVTRGSERLRGFSLADNGRAVSVRSAAGDAGSVVTFAVDRPSAMNPLAIANEHLLAEREIGAAEEIRYPSEGRTIQAWIVKPPGFDAARKYPLLLDIQDDPRRMYGVDFRLRTQIFAARGFVVLCANPRGTPGYGENFGELLRTRFPGDDFDDLMHGVDFVQARGYIDPKRVSISGSLLAAWAIGHTDRFHAAVVRRPSLARAGAWLFPSPWSDPEYVKHLPVSYAQNFKTPTLVLAAEGDAEAEELYGALQGRKVDTALLHLADPSSPGDRVRELAAVLAWLER